MKSAISFRKANVADVSFLLGLRKSTMEVHLKNAAIHLTPEEHQSRVLYQFDKAKIILYNQERIGLIKLAKNRKEYEIIQFQIDPKFQRQGIGKQILNWLIDAAKQEQKTIRLSVLKNNKAQLLYQKMGFEILDEDPRAFLMQKSC